MILVYANCSYHTDDQSYVVEVYEGMPAAGYAAKKEKYWHPEVHVYIWESPWITRDRRPIIEAMPYDEAFRVPGQGESLYHCNG